MTQQAVLKNNNTTTKDKNTVNEKPYALRNKTFITPIEYTFLAEYETINILPKFKYSSIELLDETIGPFQPHIEVSVPLWFALQLKQYKRCSIIPPRWLDPYILDQHSKIETNDKTIFQPLPYHYIEIWLLLYNSCPDDIDSKYGVNAHKIIKEKLRNIIDERENKILNGISDLNNMTKNQIFKLNNIGAMELFKHREFLISSINQIINMYPNEDNNNNSSGITNTNTNSGSYNNTSSYSDHNNTSTYTNNTYTSSAQQSNMNISYQSSNDNSRRTTQRFTDSEQQSY